VIYCSSFTKSFAPAFRLGWLSGGRHHAALERLRESSSLVSPAILLAVLSEMLASGDYARISQRIRQQLKQQMEQLSDAVLDAFPRGTRVRRPQGGMLLWVEGPEGLDSQALLEAALSRSISFAPGLVFSAEPRFGHCLRINCGQPWSTQLAEDIPPAGLAGSRTTGRAAVMEQVDCVVIGAGVVGLALPASWPWPGASADLRGRRPDWPALQQPQQRSDPCRAVLPHGQPEGAAVRAGPCHAVPLLRRAAHPAPAYRQAAAGQHRCRSAPLAGHCPTRRRQWRG
jgi:hypothetical protein